MNLPMNIGLIGCGRAAEKLYLPNLLKMNKEFRIIAVADPLPERRELFRSTILNCNAFASVEDLLKKSGVDAVIITSPPETHLDIAILSLKSGIHAFVEKPLSTLLVGTEKLESLSTSFGGKIMLGFNRRYWKPVQCLHDVLSKYDKKNIECAQLVMRSDIKSWSPVCGPGQVLDDLGSHQIDMIRYIFRCEIVSICAKKIDPQAINMKVKLDSGIYVKCLLSYGDRSYESISIKTIDHKFLIHMGSDRITPSEGLTRSMLDLTDKIVRHINFSKSSIKDSYIKELKTFLHCIRTGSSPSPGIKDGIAAIKAIDAARQSINKDGQEVSIIL